MSKHILMLLDNDFPADERVEKEATALLAVGYNVTVLCSNFKKRSDLTESYKGIDILRLNFPKSFKSKAEPFCTRFPLYQQYWLRKVKTLLKVNEYNVIHCHDLILCYVGQFIKKHYGISYVADLHENYPSLVSKKNYMRNNFYNKLFSLETWYHKEYEWIKNADLIIATASGMQFRLQNSYNLKSKFCIVENSIDLNMMRDYQFNDVKVNDKKVLLYTGGVTYHRGLQIAIEGIKLFNSNHENNEIEMWIVGTGHFESELRSMVEKSKITHVKFLGWKSHREMFNYIYSAHYCMIPHLKYEHTDNTSPNKLFHYMYMGKPILVSNCNYLIQKITESEAGVYYEFDNPMDFCNKLKLLVSGDYTKYSSNGKSYVQTRGNWDVTKKSLLESYSTL